MCRSERKAFKTTSCFLPKALSFEALKMECGATDYRNKGGTYLHEEINLDVGLPRESKISGVDLQDGHGEFLQGNTVHVFHEP